jgi:hypothetical protein
MPRAVSSHRGAERSALIEASGDQDWVVKPNRLMLSAIWRICLLE